MQEEEQSMEHARRAVNLEESAMQGGKSNRKPPEPGSQARPDSGSQEVHFALCPEAVSSPPCFPAMSSLTLHVTSSEWMHYCLKAIPWTSQDLNTEKSDLVRVKTDSTRVLDLETDGEGTELQKFKD